LCLAKQGFFVGGQTSEFEQPVHMPLLRSLDSFWVPGVYKHGAPLELWCGLRETHEKRNAGSPFACVVCLERRNASVPFGTGCDGVEGILGSLTRVGADAPTLAELRNSVGVCLGFVDAPDARVEVAVPLESRRCCSNALPD
jgi:hypothetical protein